MRNDGGMTKVRRGGIGRVRGGAMLGEGEC